MKNRVQEHMMDKGTGGTSQLKGPLSWSSLVHIGKTAEKKFCAKKTTEKKTNKQNWTKNQ